MTDESNADKEGFGESSLGDAQSENPELDPAMLMYEQEQEAGEKIETGEEETPELIASPEDESGGPAATAEHTYDERHRRDSQTPES